MLLHIPVQEAASLIRSKTGKRISLEVVNDNTINVGYDLMVKVPILGNISKSIQLDLMIEKVENDTLYLQYSSGGVGIDMILKGVLCSISTDIVQSLEGKRLSIQLNKIDKVREALKQIDIKSVTFANDNAIIDFAIKE